MMALRQSQTTIITTPKMTNLLQWNIQDLQANRDELGVLISHIHPSVVCFQETFLNKKMSPLKVFLHTIALP